MYCKYCGKEIPEGSEACPECGKILIQKQNTEGNEQVNKVFKLLSIACCLDLFKYILTFLASAYSAVLLVLTSSSGESMEVRTDLYYILIYAALFVAAINYLLKIAVTFKNKQISKYIQYALFAGIASFILSLISYSGLAGTGTLRSIIALVINAIDVVFVVMVAESIKDLSIQRGNTQLIQKVNDNRKVFIILGVVGCLLISLAIPVVYIIYLILLKQTIKEL